MTTNIISGYVENEEDETNTNGKQRLERLIKKAPKAQLHLHLDGSLSFEFIKSAMDEIKAHDTNAIVFEENWEPQNETEMIGWFIKTKMQQQLNHLKTADESNWKVFDVCNKFLQSKHNLTTATFDLIKRMNLEHNVNYLEIRFAPILHMLNGLTEKEACLAVIDGFVTGKNFLQSQGKEFYGGIILCALRSFPTSEAVKTVKLVSTLNSEYILGFDVAGDEGSYSLNMFEEALKLAKSLGIKTTVHAGEWNEQNFPSVLENLKLAVDLGINRIGHGIALRSFDLNDDIFERMKAKQIAVEICLTSNCDNESKCASYQQHPLKLFLEKKITIAGLNVDNSMLAGNHEVGLPNPTKEFVRAIFDCGISGDDLIEIIKGSYESAFEKLPQKFIDDSVQYWRDHIIPYINH